MSVKEEHSESSRLLARYISGELPPEELGAFEDMLENDPEKRTLAEEFQKIWASAAALSTGESYDMDVEWKLMQMQIPELNESKELTKATHRPARALLFYTYRIAAVVVLGLLLTFAVIQGIRNLGTQKIVTHSEPVDVVLEDGTLITLNRDSRIWLKRKFAAGERKVYLSGEAWFDVSRDTTRPFVIDAGSAFVEVLGTSFTVNAYEKNALVEISVESGVVALTGKQEQQDRKEQIILRAGNSGTYHKEKKELKLLPSMDPNHLSWKTRDLYFNGTPLREVVEVVNQVYASRLVIANESLASCEITVTFKNQSLESILRVLESTLDLELSQEGGEIRLDGAGCLE